MARTTAMYYTAKIRAFLLMALAVPASAQQVVTETVTIDMGPSTEPYGYSPWGCLSGYYGTVHFNLPDVPGQLVDSNFTGTITWEQTGSGPNGSLLFDPTLESEPDIQPSECGTEYQQEPKMVPRFMTCITTPSDGNLSYDGVGTDAARSICWGDPIPYQFPAVYATAPVNSANTLSGPISEPMTIHVGHDIYCYDKIGMWTENGWEGFWDPNVGSFTNDYRLQGVYTVTYLVPDQNVVCFGDYPLQRLETLEATYSSSDVVLTSQGENANSFGFLFFNFEAGYFPAASFVCVNGPLQRSTPYASDANGTASLNVGTLFPGTWYFQRVHRENLPGWGNASAGPALEIVLH